MFATAYAFALEHSIGGEGQVALEWVVRLRSFEDEAAASTWMHDVPEETSDRAGAVDVEEAEEMPDLGDEASAFTCVFSGAEQNSADFHCSVVGVREGSDVVLVTLGRWNEPAPGELIDELIDMQLECMHESNCTTEGPVPQELIDLAQAGLGGNAPGSKASDIGNSSSGFYDEPAFIRLSANAWPLIVKEDATSSSRGS